MHELLDGQMMMGRDVLEKSVEQINLQWVMIGHGHMMFPIPLGGELDMGAGLTPRLVSQVPESTRQFNAVAVAGNLHAASTSSRT